MTEDEKGFEVKDRRGTDDREAEKRAASEADNRLARQRINEARLQQQREELLKCPNCKWKKQAKRFLQMTNPNMPPFIACPNCGAVFLHAQYVKGVLKVLEEKEKAKKAGTN